MRVLVTGATGFVGNAIAHALAAEGHVVHAAARNPQTIIGAAGLEPTLLPDLASAFDAGPLLQAMDAVVHAAGLAHQQPGTSEADLHRINAEGAGRLAACAARAGIARFVLISSIRAVSGPCSLQPLTEADAPAPTDAYGRSKLAGEASVRVAFPAATVLRPPVIHGAFAKGNMARLAALARLPLPLPLAGFTAKRSLASDRNLASAAAFALTSPVALAETFHLDDGAPLSLAEIATIMRASRGRPPRLFHLPGMMAATGLLSPAFRQQLEQGLTVSADLIRSRGWQPVEASEAGLARMVLARG
jgi:nucleoside-diphosphate-sugar epimerase